MQKIIAYRCIIKLDNFWKIYISYMKWILKGLGLLELELILSIRPLFHTNYCLNYQSIKQLKQWVCQL